jgi:NTE family protein
VRVGVVLSTGGLRGAAHLGVLKRLIAARLPIDILVGSSVGAVLGAYYAAVGMSIEDIIADAPRINAKHLFWHSMRYRTPGWAQPWIRARSGIVPARLEALDQASFDRLHHGISTFGVVCHDLESRKGLYVSTADTHGLPLAGVVRASAAIRLIYPAWAGEAEGRRVRLIDGGYSDTLPTAFARDLGATHLIVSDCRRTRNETPDDDHTVWVRPALQGLGIVRAVSFTLDQAIRAGEDAVTDVIIDRVKRWFLSISPSTAP